MFTAIEAKALAARREETLVLQIEEQIKVAASVGKDRVIVSLPADGVTTIEQARHYANLFAGAPRLFEAQAQARPSVDPAIQTPGHFDLLIRWTTC